jgi:hypothetical protein
MAPNEPVSRISASDCRVGGLTPGMFGDKATVERRRLAHRLTAAQLATAHSATPGTP